jgi:hypothetical protein
MKAAGITEPAVAYDAPSRVEIEDKTAYVIVPTVYTYKEQGRPTAEEGQMTFVLNRGAAGWKIGAWTWSGVKPHPAK